MDVYILIHGIGNQAPKLQWFYEAIAPLKDTILYPMFRPFYWEDLREPPLEKHLQEVRCPLFPPHVLGAYSTLLDLLTYSVTYEAVMARLDKLVSSCDGEVTLVAHSMGSVVAYEYLRTGANADKVKKLITLGSPIGRRPVSTRIAKRLGAISPLPNVVWWNIAGGLDAITSWLGGGTIKEATINRVIPFQTHDLVRYMSDAATLEALYSRLYMKESC